MGSPQFPPGSGRYTEEEDWLEGRWMQGRAERMDRPQGLSISSAPKEVWPTSGGVGEDEEKEKNTPSIVAHLFSIKLCLTVHSTFSSAQGPHAGSDRPGAKSLRHS